MKFNFIIPEEPISSITIVKHMAKYTWVYPTGKEEKQETMVKNGKESRKFDR